MLCPNCGVQFNGNPGFCASCGMPLPKQAEAPTYAVVQNYSNADYYANAMNIDKYISGVKPVFILGIISIATGIANITLASIICGVISLIKLGALPNITEEYITDPGKLSEYRSAVKKAKTAKKLAIAGILIGVVTELLIWAAGVFVALALGIASEAAYFGFVGLMDGLFANI